MGQTRSSLSSQPPYPPSSSPASSPASSSSSSKRQSKRVDPDSPSLSSLHSDSSNNTSAAGSTKSSTSSKSKSKSKSKRTPPSSSSSAAPAPTAAARHQQSSETTLSDAQRDTSSNDDNNSVIITTTTTTITLVTDDTESDTRNSTDTTNTTTDDYHDATTLTDDSSKPLPSIAITKPSTFYNPWEPLPTLPPSASQFMDEMEKTSNFNQHELDRLRKRFMKLDSDGSGSIDREEFLQIPQIANNPLASRMIAIFDDDGGGTVDFQEFVGGLSAFSSRGGREEKLRFAFKVYDIDRDGYISNGELFLVLKMMVGNNLKDTQLQQIVDKTIMEADKDGDGKLSFEEFTQMVAKTDIVKQMTLEDLF